jgi:transposase
VCSSDLPIVAARRAARQAFYDEVQRLHAAGVSIHAIGAQTGTSRVTVRKYLRAASCPHRAARRTKVGALTAFDAHLRARWAAGCQDATVLWQELVARGFRGTRRTIQRHVARWPLPAGHRRRGRRPRHMSPADSPPAAPPPSPRVARWWLILPYGTLSTDQRQYVVRLTTACAPVRTAQALAVEFGRLVRTRDVAALADWLDDAAASDHAEFRDLAASLRRDLAAVTAAVREPWSNGQTEGQVNRLKMLKRQMYGRASVALLRQRLLLGT